ncbi:hypothetical protein [Frankia sp. Cr1]|uniref:hypothetical protein n=1 Tax=Frankia sp. Cr1 TaxID=3073931 RepID=UPI002AD3E178|nr:hypothetical protein [Frankia sp. Cr1]
MDWIIALRAPAVAAGRLTLSHLASPPGAGPVKDGRKETPDQLPVYSCQGLLAHLAAPTRAAVTFVGQHIEKISISTVVQRRLFELIGAPIPLSLSGR